MVSYKIVMKRYCVAACTEMEPQRAGVSHSGESHPKNAEMTAQVNDILETPSEDEIK